MRRWFLVFVVVVGSLSIPSDDASAIATSDGLHGCFKSITVGDVAWDPQAHVARAESGSEGCVRIVAQVSLY